MQPAYRCFGLFFWVTNDTLFLQQNNAKNKSLKARNFSQKFQNDINSGRSIEVNGRCNKKTSSFRAWAATGSPTLIGVRKLLLSSSGYGGGRLVDYFSQDCVHCQHLKPVSDLIDATSAVGVWWVRSVFVAFVCVSLCACISIHMLFVSFVVNPISQTLGHM